MKKPRVPKWTVYRDKRNQWRWRFTSSNGNVLADSGESYKRRIDAKGGIALLIQEGPVFAPSDIQLMSQTVKAVALAIFLLVAGPVSAQEKASIQINGYAFKGLRGPSESAVEFGARFVARAPLAFGSSSPFTVSAETAIISQSPEPLSSADVGLVKGVDVLLAAEHRIGSVNGAHTSLVGLWGFSSALPGEATRDRTLRRYGVGLRVSHPSSGASGRLVWGRDEGVGARGLGQFMFDGVVPLAGDGALIGGLSAAVAAGSFPGQDRVLIWVGTDPVALIKRLGK